MSDKLHKYLKSDQFKQDMTDQINKNTWEHPTPDGRGIPKIYMDDNGDIIEHWKDGTINILHKKEDLI